MKRALSILLPLIAIALLAGAGVWYFHYKSLHPSTEDAYVEAHTINIAPQINGTVNAVHVSENQHVKKNQVLFTIDATPFNIAKNEAAAKIDQIKDQLQSEEMQVNSARAKLAQSKAELVNTRLTSARILSLVKKGYVSKSEGDNAIKNLTVAQQQVASAKSLLAQALSQRGAIGDKNAQLRAAQGKLQQADLNLSYTTVRAPANGYIENFNLRRGAVVSAFNPLFAIVEDNHWWVKANFKETSLERLKPGQSVKIKLDMYPGHYFHGKILSLASSSSGSFSLLPPENASANWVKVTQRFPVRILITDNNNPSFPLRLGASAAVTVNTIK